MDDAKQTEIRSPAVQPFETPSVIRLDEGPGKWLRWLLAIIGSGLMIATIPVFFPVVVIETVHRWLGLGEFPDGPIPIYLARSTSMLYAVHGFLMLFVSFDLKRYWPLAQWFGWLHVVMGLVIFGVDVTTPMPSYWVAGEGIPIMLAGLLIVWLWRRANRQSSTKLN